MKVDLFDFELPRERIALKPASPRDAARLLYIQGQALRDHSIRDLPSLLQPGDLIIFNDTKVIPARLMGKRGDAKIEVTLHKSLGEGRWQAFAKPGKRLRVGDEVSFGQAYTATVEQKLETGEVVLHFPYSPDVMMEKLAHFGSMPLPPYISRDTTTDIQDESDYQTMFAKHSGAVAAPTAGLHFTPELFAALQHRGVEHAYVTLHVGAGTFLPVKVEDTSEHVMHYETAILTQEVADVIRAAKQAGRRIVAVGTTALRTLESAVDSEGGISAFSGETNLFITPGYNFRVVDVLLTNFHLPRSTLFMLVSAFAGREEMLAAYAHAIKAGYRFYSYGDACLLERKIS